MCIRDRSTIALFADDAYLLKSISSQHDVDILQGDLNIYSKLWSPVNQISLIRKIEMVQHKAVRWICSNWDRVASVSNMEASLCMKKLEYRRSIAQLKMMRDLITGEKQNCKKSLPVRQCCTDV